MSRASEYARNVSDLYSQQGQAYATAAANKAAIWGGTVAKLGDFAANTVQVYSAQKQDKRLKDLFERASQEYQAGQSGIVSEESGRRIADAIAREKAAGTYQGLEPFSTRGALPQPINAPTGGTTLPQPINAPTGGTAFTGPQRPPRQSPMPTLGELINVVGPERAIKIADGLKGLQAIASPQVPFEKKMSGLRDTMLGLNALSPEMRKEMYPHARQVVLGAGLGINPADVPEQFDENWFQSIVNYGKQPEKAAAEAKPPALGSAEDYITRYATEQGKKPEQLTTADIDAARKAYAAQPDKPAKEATPGSFEDYVARYAAGKGTTVDKLTTKDIEDARKRYQQADDRPPSVTVNMPNTDISAIGDAIINGDQPPTLQGLYRNGAAVRAYLAKKGYDLANAQTDWTATQKHISTLNGAQQTRMAQAIDNASHSLDVIEELSNKWKGGRFPALNKATLLAAKQGAMGANAQQLATLLDAQIADVTSELANVYMGGNSPTDHALELASKNLSANWTQAQLNSAIEQSKRNLQIRQNSMRNVGVAGASPTNPYAPPPQTPPPQTVNPKDPMGIR